MAQGQPGLPRRHGFVTVPRKDLETPNGVRSVTRMRRFSAQSLDGRVTVCE